MTTRRVLRWNLSPRDLAHLAALLALAALDWCCVRLEEYVDGQ